MTTKLTVISCTQSSCGHAWEATMILRAGKRWVLAHGPNQIRCPKCHSFKVSTLTQVPRPFKITSASQKVPSWMGI